MASNYTTNYGLPIWAADDAFLRTEFNDANQKIDAALEENCYRKISNGQLKADSSKLTIDLTGINLGCYQFLEFFLSGKTDSNVSLYMTFNENHEEEYFSAALGDVQSDKNTCVGLTSGFQTLGSCTCRLYPVGVKQAVGYSHQCTGTGSSGYLHHSFASGCHTKLLFQALTSIEIYPQANHVLCAGTRYTLYGLRK